MKWKLKVAGVCRQLLRSLGEAGEIEPETDGILIEYNIDTTDFSEEVFCNEDYRLNKDTMMMMMTVIISIIVRPLRSTTYVDAAYCYRPSSVVCRSVCHTSEPCKNG